MKNKIVTISLCIFLLLLPKHLLAWNIHGEMTKIVLDSLPWINRYKDITITQYSYADSSIYNSKYRVSYLEGDIGEKTNAKTILSLYADEPDWGMDEGLSLNSAQVLTGGSQGWRHQYFLLFGGFVKLGEAPSRAVHFYNMARLAFEKHDTYWGFRFLARALHYLQDLTMPFHANPGPVFILLRNITDINGLTNMVSNHHFALEDYQEYQVRKRNLLYIKALRRAEPLKVDDVWTTGSYLANKSKDYSERLWELQTKIYGETINSRTRHKINPEKVASGELKNEYDKIIIGCLIDFSAVTKGFLNYARALFRSSN
ncbi:MAG: hypothetical protein N2380_05755 [bacterium]|nr:hypothetical protein [bacterium]